MYNRIYSFHQEHTCTSYSSHADHLVLVVIISLKDFRPEKLTFMFSGEWKAFHLLFCSPDVNQRIGSLKNIFKKTFSGLQMGHAWFTERFAVGTTKRRLQ